MDGTPFFGRHRSDPAKDAPACGKWGQVGERGAKGQRAEINIQQKLSGPVPRGCGARRPYFFKAAEVLP